MTKNERQKSGVLIHGDVNKVITIGTVYGDVIINSADAITQMESRRRKNWRKLSGIVYPLLSDEFERETRIFMADMALCLPKVFSNTGYITFNGMLGLQKLETPEGDSQCFKLHCHQIEFCELVYKRQYDYVKSTIEIKDFGTDSEGRTGEDLRISRVREKEAFISDWSLSGGLEVSRNPSPVEFIFDPAAKRITIETIKDSSVDPVGYPNFVTTTSEALCYIANLLNSTLSFVGDIANLGKRNYPLLKLLMHSIDAHEIKFNLFRINSDDYEEWDYLNPAFDQKILSLQDV